MKTVKGFSKIVAMVGAVALGLTLSACGNTNSASNTDSKNSGSTPTVSFMLDWTPNTNHIGLYVARLLQGCRRQREDPADRPGRS